MLINFRAVFFFVCLFQVCIYHKMELYFSHVATRYTAYGS